MSNTKQHIMKFVTTDKLAHQWENFKATEGARIVVASVSKEGAVWNWAVRVSYTHTDGVQYINEAEGWKWSKPEAVEAFKARALDLFTAIEKKF
jgi:hypothetical protein